jgi:hypothetical protein
MPNWCSNSITIEGPADKIRALWDAAQPAEGKDGSLLDAMVPIGEWEYDTAVQNWGTKWDISLEGLEFVPGDNGRAMITGWADSAWAPPVNAFQTYANANEDCSMELKYFEPGMCFVGVWDSEGGDAYWEDIGSLLETTEEEDSVLYELLEHFNVWDWFETDEEEDTIEE